MPQQFWKTLDEYHGQAPHSDDEFDAEVQRALQALRTEHGIDEQGHVATDDAGRREHRVDDPVAHARDLRALLPATSRRGFMQLTGAAAVFGLAGCWYEAPETLVPHVVQPPGSTVGNARYYSTTIRVDGRPVGVMAKSYDGRPIKLEGNPDHPQSRGALGLRGQASILDLYDADRQRQGPVAIGQRARPLAGSDLRQLVGDAGGLERLSWKELDQAVGTALQQSGSVALLSGPIDGPATLRSQLSRMGEPGVIVRRRPTARPRRVVFLIDVSGSMSAYADALLRLAHTYLQVTPRGTEVFTVGTRLTRVTRALRHRDPDHALLNAGAAVADWSGGTRLGEVLGAFMDRWGRRGMARGSVVVIFSDGWERTQPELLGEQMRQLSAIAHRVVWVNPHRGRAGYAPVQSGIVAALPHVDDFVAGHSLAAFADVLEVVARA